MVEHQPDFDGEFRILSYTSLSTPHNGTVLADLQVAYSDAVMDGVSDPEFIGFPEFTERLANLIPALEGTEDLTTARSRVFNSKNHPALPPWTVYHTIGADADEDSSGTINDTSEHDGFTAENLLVNVFSSLLPGYATRHVDAMYQILSETAEVSMVTTDLTFAGDPRPVKTVSIASIPTAGDPQRNDLMVTESSAHGILTFESNVRASATLLGLNGRDHATVADFGPALAFMDWLLDVDRRHLDGDLND